MVNLESLFQKTEALSQQEKNYLLLDAIQIKNPIFVDFALAIGADVSFNNNAAIRLNSHSKNVAVADRLIEAGADVTAKNNESLYYALSHQHKEMADRLMKAGADITARNGYLLSLSIENNYEDFVQAYIDAGGIITDDIIQLSIKLYRSNITKMLIEKIR